MAKEKWTVFFEVRNAGAQSLLNFKEGDILVKGKEKCNGLTNEKRESGKTQSTSSPFITNEVNQAFFVTLEAEGAEEALAAVTKFYGQGVATQKGLAALSANLTEAATI